LSVKEDAVALSDLSLPVLVIIFLAIFVLIGIHPALQRTVSRIRTLIQTVVRTKAPISPGLEDVHAEMFAGQQGAEQMNDFENIVLRRIAQAGGKALTRRQLNASLLFDKANLYKTLQSLNRRGLVLVKVSKLLGMRFALSEAGRRYALEQGYLLQIHENKRPLG
jgi:hypothetical protein